MQDEGALLYERFLKGNKAALDDLISLYRPKLYPFVFSYVRDKAAVEDVLQNVFFRLYRSRSFARQTGGTLKGYLYQIAKNESLNALKKRKRLREISLEELQASPKQAYKPALLDDGGFFSDKEAQTEKARLVAKGLASLKKEYRQALKLRFFYGYSPKKIAKIMNKDVKQVYNLLTRGKTALKMQLQDKKEALSL